MPLLPLSQAPAVCTSFGRWFRAALSPLLLGFQSVPLAFHHWDRHLVISCIPEQASIESPPRHPTRRTDRTLKNGPDMVPPWCSSASPDTRQFRGRFWCTNTPRWEKAPTRPGSGFGSATIDRGRRTSVSSVSIILQAWINFSTFPMAIGGRRILFTDPCGHVFRIHLLFCWCWKMEKGLGKGVKNVQGGYAQDRGE